jgi:hypothetical protein
MLEAFQVNLPAANLEIEVMLAVAGRLRRNLLCLRLRIHRQRAND